MGKYGINRLSKCLVALIAWIYKSDVYAHELLDGDLFPASGTLASSTNSHSKAFVAKDMSAFGAGRLIEAIPTNPASRKGIRKGWSSWASCRCSFSSGSWILNHSIAYNTIIVLCCCPWASRRYRLSNWNSLYCCQVANIGASGNRNDLEIVGMVLWSMDIFVGILVQVYEFGIRGSHRWYDERLESVPVPGYVFCWSQ